MSKTCKNCGKEVIEGASFCDECGTRIEAEASDSGKDNKAPDNADLSKSQTPTEPKAAAAATQSNSAAAQCGSAVTQPSPMVTQSGSKTTSETANRQQYTGEQTYPASNPGEAPPPRDSKYAPISTLGFLGIMILCSIPIIGPLLILIWALGGCKKVSKRSYARASIIMFVITLVFSIIMVFVAKTLVEKAFEVIQQEIGIDFSGENIEDIFGDLGELLGGASGELSLSGDQLGDLVGLVGMLGGASGSGSGDMSELVGMPALIGDGSGGVNDEELKMVSGILSLFGGVDKINAEAEKHSDGWPSELPKFPSGRMNELESYRTEFEGSTFNDMQSYIAALKQNGFHFEDFYGFGMTEESMSESGWWGYNGTWYVALSYTGTGVIVDHVSQLPELGGFLG